VALLHAVGVHDRLDVVVGVIGLLQRRRVGRLGLAFAQHRARAARLHRRVGRCRVRIGRRLGPRLLVRGFLGLGGPFRRQRLVAGGFKRQRRPALDQQAEQLVALFVHHLQRPGPLAAARRAQQTVARRQFQQVLAGGIEAGGEGGPRGR